MLSGQRSADHKRAVGLCGVLRANLPARFLRINDRDSGMHGMDCREWIPSELLGATMHSAGKPIAFSEGLISAAGTAYLIVLFVAGFLTNFVPIASTNTGTILLYSLGCCLSLAGLLYLFGPLRKPVAIAAAALLIVSCLALVKAAFDSNPGSQRASELAIYFFGAWPFLFFLQIKSPKVRQLLFSTLALGLFGLSIFAIFQGVLAQSLPLSMFALRGDPAVGIGDDQFRPTGLTGNPIVFSSILVFASAYFSALWLEGRKFRFLIAVICSLVANYLTYTRASIVLVIPVLVFTWLFYKRFHVRHKIAVLAALLLIILSGQYLLVQGGNSILIQRLQLTNEESIKSTLDHFVQIENAKNTIVAHPLTGAGMGSQGNSVGPENVIITDGAWWILLLEFGVPLSILILASLGFVLISLAKDVLSVNSKNRTLAIAVLAFHAYVIPANFINSALLGHISFGLYWAVLGLSIAGISYNSMGARGGGIDHALACDKTS
jgi:hypothetical protein